MWKIYAASYILFTLTAAADRVFVFFHWMYKNEIQLLSTVACQSRKSDFGWHCFRFSPCLKSLKQYCHLRQDNTRCYHWANTILACRTFEQSTGIKVVCMDFSDPQGVREWWTGWRPLAKTTSEHTSINASNNVTTVEMKEALLSYGGVEGVWVAILLSIEETVELQKVSGISKINNPRGKPR